MSNRKSEQVAEYMGRINRVFETAKRAQNANKTEHATNAQRTANAQSQSHATTDSQY